MDSFFQPAFISKRYSPVGKEAVLSTKYGNENKARHSINFITVIICPFLARKSRSLAVPVQNAKHQSRLNHLIVFLFQAGN